MAFCKNCGSAMGDEKFCTNCGIAADTASKTEFCGTNASKTVKEPNDTGLNIKMLVWSIINTVLCCQILGIISLVFTILAAEISDKARATKYLKVAKILNIIGVVCMAIYVLLMIAYVILIIIAGGLWGLGAMSMLGMV